MASKAIRARHVSGGGGARLPDVLLRGVAEDVELRLVGPEHVAGAAEPVHRDGRFVQEVHELLRSGGIGQDGWIETDSEVFTFSVANFSAVTSETGLPERIRHPASPADIDQSYFLQMG